MPLIDRSYAALPAASTSASDRPCDFACTRASSAAVCARSSFAFSASRSRNSLRETPASRARSDWLGGHVVISVRNMSAPISTQIPVNDIARNPEITANVDASGLPTTHIASSNTPDSESARLTPARSLPIRYVQRARLMAPHGGTAAKNGTMQNRIHGVTCARTQVTNETAASIQITIVGIDTCRCPNRSTSVPSSGPTTAPAIACTAVSAPASGNFRNIAGS